MEARALQIVQLSCGSFSMVRSFAFKQDGGASAPAIFISNQTEAVVASESSEFAYQSRWHALEYSECMIAEVLYDNSIVSDIRVVVRTLKLPSKTLDQ